LIQRVQLDSCATAFMVETVQQVSGHVVPTHRAVRGPGIVLWAPTWQKPDHTRAPMGRRSIMTLPMRLCAVTLIRHARCPGAPCPGVSVRGRAAVRDRGARPGAPRHRTPGRPPASPMRASWGSWRRRGLTGAGRWGSFPSLEAAGCRDRRRWSRAARGTPGSRRERWAGITPASLGMSPTSVAMPASPVGQVDGVGAVRVGLVRLPPLFLVDEGGECG
jgi:hypothetical protein